MNKKYYINVGMGLGGNICLASFLTKAKELHPDDEYNVCSPYWDIYKSCDAVTNVYQPQEMHDFIFDAKDNDGVIVNHRLYDMSGFIYKLLDYEEAWAQLLGYDDEELKTSKDGMNIKSVLNPVKAFPFLQQQFDDIKKQLKGNKFIITQWHGGQSPLVNVPAGKNGQPDWSKVPYNYDNEPLKRHYPTDNAQEFLNLFKQEHPDIEVIEYSLPNEPHCNNTIKFVAPYLAYYLLAKDKDCVGAVTIDSSLQHLIAGVTKNVVIWGHSINALTEGDIIKNNFGYEFNKNIVQKCRRDDILYFTALGASAARVSYIPPSDLLIQVNEHLFNKTK